MRSKYAVILCILIPFYLGCGGKEMKIDPTKQTDSQIFSLGEKQLKDGDYAKSRDSFKAVFENFPKSDYRILAKLSYADSFYEDGGEANYVLAIQEYQDFITLFPFSPKAEYAQYQLGMCYYNMIEKPDRDQTNTRKALDEFRKMVDNYPTGEHYPDAYKMLVKCYSHLAEHEYGIAHYYYRTHHYQASVERLKKLLKDYPESVYDPKHFFYLAASLEHLSQNSESCVYYDRLLSKWKSSDYNAKAQEAKNRLCPAIASAPSAPSTPSTPSVPESQPQTQTQPQ